MLKQVSMQRWEQASGKTIEQVIDDCRSGRTTVYRAAREHGIPYASLYRWVHSPRLSRSGQSQS